MTWWVLPLALVVGLLLGLLGGGGAILTVPILTALLHQTPAQATAGSLVVVGLSSIVGVIPHLRSGRARVADGIAFGLLGVVGAAAGSRASVAVPGHVLMTAFSALLLAVAALMWRRRAQGPSPVAVERGWPARIAAATGVGLLTGFFGVGGGFVVVPALILVLGVSMSTAVATSLLVIAINSAASTSTGPPSCPSRCSPRPEPFSAPACPGGSSSDGSRSRSSPCSSRWRPPSPRRISPPCSELDTPGGILIRVGIAHERASP